MVGDGVGSFVGADEVGRFVGKCEMVGAGEDGVGSNEMVGADVGLGLGTGGGVCRHRSLVLHALLTAVVSCRRAEVHGAKRTAHGASID